MTHSFILILIVLTQKPVIIQLANYQTLVLCEAAGKAWDQPFQGLTHKCVPSPS